MQVLRQKLSTMDEQTSTTRQIAASYNLSSGVVSQPCLSTKYNPLPLSH